MLDLDNLDATGPTPGWQTQQSLRLAHIPVDTLDDREDRITQRFAQDAFDWREARYAWPACGPSDDGQKPCRWDFVDDRQFAASAPPFLRPIDSFGHC